MLKTAARVEGESRVGGKVEGGGGRRSSSLFSCHDSGYETNFCELCSHLVKFRGPTGIVQTQQQTSQQDFSSLDFLALVWELAFVSFLLVEYILLVMPDVVKTSDCSMTFGEFQIRSPTIHFNACR